MPDPVTKARIRIAPTSRAGWAAALLLVPAALAEAAFPAVAGLAFPAWALGLALAAVVDAAVALGRGEAAGARAPALTRLSLGRAGVVETEVRGAGAVELGIAFPEELGAARSERRVALGGPKVWTRIAWEVRPGRRGSWRLGDLWLGRASPLGLFAVRRPLALEGEVRVYPDLRAEGRALVALLTRREAPGPRAHRVVGRGREFEKLREYLPGDGIDEIHWKATAKRGHPVTKVFRVERTQEVYGIVDASRLSARDAGAAATLLERQVNGALALALAAERQGDLFGLALFADRPRALLRAGGGPAHFQACREALVRVRPEAVTPDFREVCGFLRTRLSKRALLVFFTSLDDPALEDAFVESVRLLAARHLVLVASPLPADARPLFSEAPPGSLDEAYARLGGHLRWQGLQELGARLHRLGVRLALLGRDELAAGAVSHYLALKQRQAL